MSTKFRVLVADQIALDGLAPLRDDSRFELIVKPGLKGADLAAAIAAADAVLVRSATQITRESLAQANQEYEDRFGHVFIVSAHGKTADDIVSSLRDRLKNDPAREIEVAAAEERLIMKHRLETLFA